MTTTSTYKPTKFRVERAHPDTDKWTITEDGDHNCPVDWSTRPEAVAALARIRVKAEAVTRCGFFVTDKPGEIWVSIDHNRVDIVLPYMAAPAVIRHTIRRAAMQHYIDQETGS